jgi:hypothetical protein
MFLGGYEVVDVVRVGYCLLALSSQYSSVQVDAYRKISRGLTM